MSAPATGPARELTLARRFDAPRALVWQAWTDPALIARWWCPEGFTIPHCEADPRPGGGLHLVMRGPDGGDYPMRATYHEVAPPERLVFTSDVEDGAGAIVLQVRHTVTLAEHGERTELTLHAEVLTVRGVGMAYLEGMEPGWMQSLDKLAALLASRH